MSTMPPGKPAARRELTVKGVADLLRRRGLIDAAQHELVLSRGEAQAAHLRGLLQAGSPRRLHARPRGCQAVHKPRPRSTR